MRRFPSVLVAIAGVSLFACLSESALAADVLRFVRFADGDKIAYGIVKGEKVHEIEGVGMLIIGHTVGWKLFGNENKLIAERTGGVDLAAHHQNFFDVIRGDQKELAADAKAGFFSATMVHLANIAARVGRTLDFQPDNETIVGDDEAAAMVRRRYRDNHWAVPKGM